MDRRSLAVGMLVVLVALAGCSTSSTGITYETGPTAADLSTGGPNRGTAWAVTITDVVDGDTVEARFPNGEVDTLRLLGVDTPETNAERVSPTEFEGIPDTDAGREHLLTWGERASAFATAELEGETVRIAVDREADRRGGYGRLLVYVYHDGEIVNERLLSGGYARLYDSPFSLRTAFERVEADARSAERGLWAFDGAKTAASLGGHVARTSVGTDRRRACPLADSHVERVSEAQYGTTLGAFVDDTAHDLGVGHRDRLEFSTAVRAVTHASR